HTFQLSDSANWLALAVYFGTAIVVGLLAARARRRRADAEQRRLEAQVLADAASLLLRGLPVERLTEPLGAALDTDALRVVSGELVPEAGERALPVTAADTTVATVLVDEHVE